MSSTAPSPTTAAALPQEPDASQLDLQCQYMRAARAATSSRGDRCGWTMPERSDTAPTAEQVVGWIRQLLTVPWCLTSETADKACVEFDRLRTAVGGRPARIEVVRHVAGDSTHVFLAVTAAGDEGGAKQPLIASVKADVERRG